MLNAPFNGGTHLPDVTVITPVFGEDGDDILFWVGSRGHHADIGGKTPGSGPPDSTHIDEEGVVIDNFRLVERGPSGPRTPARSCLGPLPLPQHRSEHGRSGGADCRQRNRHPRSARDDRQFRPRHRARLHAPRAGQRRGQRAPRHRLAQGRDLHLPLDDGSESASRSPWTATGRGDDRLHRHQPAAPGNYNAPKAIATRPSFTSSARSWAATSR
jgi:hypothetical protein